MWWRRSWFSLKGKAGIPGQTEGRPATPIALRAPPAGSLQQRDAHGPEALGDLRRRNGSAPSVLRPELLARLPERLATPPSDGGLWTGPKVAAWMAGELGLAAVLPQR